jgi:hypothetical protein
MTNDGTPSRGTSFGSASLRGMSSLRGGLVDHRMARRATINEVHRGRLGREEVCDAHPELMRAARSVGKRTETPCPICSEDNLVLVTYVVGSPPTTKNSPSSTAGPRSTPRMWSRHVVRAAGTTSFVRYPSGASAVGDRWAESSPGGVVLGGGTCRVPAGFVDSVLA